MKTSLCCLTVMVAFLFSGCVATKYDEFSMDKAVKVAKRTDNLKLNHLSNQLQSKVVKLPKDDFIMLNQNYDLETLLLKLSGVDGRIYYLKNYKDFIVPISNTKIHNFKELQKYLEDVSDIKLEIIKNKYRKTLPKILKVSSISNKKLSLDDIVISLEKDSTLIDLVEYINNNTKYSIFIDKNSFKKVEEDESSSISTNSSSTDNDTDDIVLDDELKLNYKININNWKLNKLIDYLQYSLNLFVDIDYDKKMILISKMKISSLDIVIPNIKTEYDDRVKDLSTLTVAEESDSSSQTIVTDDVASKIYSELKKNIAFILTNFSENSEVYINETTGTIDIRSSFLALQKINKIISKFNNDFSKQIVLTVSFYDIILNKEHTLGLDFAKTTTTGTNYKNRFVQNNFVFKNVSGKKWGFFLDSLHKLGYLYNIEEYDVLLTNNIPFEDKDLITTKYIASKTTTVNTTSGGTTSSEDYTRDEYQEGYNITYLPKIGKNNQVFIKMNIAQKILENLETETYGTSSDTFSLPSVRDVVKSPLLKLKAGEGSIVWQRKYLDVADNYSGIIPLEDFIIGGTSGKNFVLKEYLMLVRVKKIK